MRHRVSYKCVWLSSTTLVNFTHDGHYTSNRNICRRNLLCMLILAAPVGFGKLSATSVAVADKFLLGRCSTCSALGSASRQTLSGHLGSGQEVRCFWCLTRRGGAVPTRNLWGSSFPAWVLGCDHPCAIRHHLKPHRLKQTQIVFFNFHEYIQLLTRNCHTDPK